jgi:hypothetical protein
MPPDWLLAVLDLVAIVTVAWFGGIVMQWLHQPRIAGEMAAVFAAGLLLPASRPRARSPTCFRGSPSRSSPSSVGSG